MWKPYRWYLLVALVAVIALGCSRGTTTTTPGGDGDMSPTITVHRTNGSPTGETPDSGPPFRLSEGSEGYQPDLATPPVVETTPLSAEIVQAILARLPSVQTTEEDVQEYALPQESLPPPLPGETVDVAFPPAATEAPGETGETGPLQVLRFAPEGDVPVVPHLSVTFSQPMVPLTSHQELAEKDVPVNLTPDVPGHWRWVGTKTLFFEADLNEIDRFPMATEYHAEIPAGTTSATGGVLAESVAWTFRTPPPQLQNTYPSGGPQRLDPLLFASFDQRIEPAAVLETVRVMAGGEAFPVRLATASEVQEDNIVRRLSENAGEGRWLAFRADTPFPPDTTVNVNFGPGTPSAEGPRTTQTPQSYTFRTYGPLLVQEHRCAWGGNQCPPFTPWSITFTNPLDTEAFDASMVRVEPALSNLDIEVFGNVISLQGNTQGRTTYRVTLNADIQDQFGQTLGKDVTVSFRVGSAEPLLNAPGGNLVVMDPSGPPLYSVFTINMSRINVRVYSVQPEDYPLYLEFQSNYRREETPPDPPGKEVYNDSIQVSGENDQLVETPIDLRQALDGETGHLIVVVEPDPGLLSTLLRGVRNLRYMTQIAWVQVTDIGLDAFMDNDQVVAWANALQDGTPLGGATISLWPTDISEETDQTGTTTLPLPDVENSGAQLLIARQGDDSAFLPENRYYGSSDRGWKQAPQTLEDRWYVFDDRQMYRPGETVHAKGWIRAIGTEVGGDVGLFGAQAATDIRYQVIGPRGNEIASGQSTLNSLGGFHLSFDLPENINLGYAQLQLSATGGYLESSRQAGRYTHSFQVQEFRRPEFEVSTSASPGPHIVGDHAIATVKAAYYAGGPLPGADVNWLVSASPGSYRPPNWNGFIFGRWVPWWRFEAGPSGMQRSSSFESRTDAAGEHNLRIDFEAADPPQPMRIQAEATVMDVNRQAWSASTNLLVHPAQLYVGLRTDRYFVERGTPLDVEIVVTDLEGNAIPEHEVTVRAARLDWMYKDGSWQEVEEDVQTCVVETTDAASPDAADAEFATCTFETPIGGTFRITALIEDAAGRSNQTELTRWVSGGQRPPSRDVEQEEVTLIPSSDSYQPGDNAEILVQSPFAPAEGVLTLRRNGLVRTERFSMDESTYTLQIPIEEEYVPNLYVQVDLVGEAPRVNDTGEVDESLPKRPAYAMGRINLPVPPLNRTLAVQATPQETNLEPGGQTTIDLAVKDATGQPVADAELAVVVVDEAVLALTNYQLIDPITVFYNGRSAGVSDYHNRADLLLIRPEMLTELGAEAASGMMRSVQATAGAPAMEEAADMAAMPLEAPAAAEPGAEPIQVRTNFDALALFAPEVRTDADGLAQVQVNLPDSLTRYRVMVVAVAREKFFGSAESNLTARLPLMVRPSAPRFLNFGDRFELPVVLQNQTDAPLTVDVAVQATNADLTADSAFTSETSDAAGQQVTIPANDRVEVRFPTTTASAGTARFQFAAIADNPTGGQWADAAEVSLPVWTPATTEAFAVYGEVDEGAVMQPVQPPDDVIPIYGGLEVSTSSTALQTLTDAFLYLVDYPFECSEQIASRLLAVAALQDVLTAFDAPGLPAPGEIATAVERDLQRLQSLQNNDGGFPIWRRGQQSWPYYSVHAAHALARARQKDFDVPEEMFARSLSYLREIEGHIPYWYSQKARNSIIAYALYVRKQMGDVSPAEARQLIDQEGLENLSLESVGWLLYVLTDDPASEQTVTAIRRYLNNRVAETAGAANFVDSYDDGQYLLLYSDRRADGVILEALMADQPDSDLIPKLVRGLLGHRTKGRWSNTQENVFILLAMDRYFNVYEAQTPDFVARVWLGDQYAGSHEFRGRTTETANIEIPMGFVLDAGAAAEGETLPLILQKEGPGRLYYRLGLRYAPTDLALDPADHGFTVQRRYEAVDDPEDVTQDEEGVWHVKAGTRVRVQLTMVAPSRRVHVALIDPMPAGFEALNPALAVTGELPQDPESRGTPYGWWWWGPWYEHQNLRDERAEAFASQVWAGVYTYTYVARATTPGEFVAPPAKAEEMYAPEVFGRSGTDRVVVE